MTATPGKRYQWATTPAVLDGATLTKVATIGGGYFVTQGTGGWVSDTAELFEETAVVLQVDGITVGQRNLIENVLVEAAHAVGELALWRTVTDLHDVVLVDVIEEVR